jgi:hypothetical protein
MRLAARFARFRRLRLARRLFETTRIAPLDKFGQFSDNRRQFDGVAVEMNRKLLEFAGFSGATRRIRTDDLLITNQLLYRLS